MKIFDKRPLSLILCILLGAFVIFSFGSDIFKLILILSSIIILFLSFFLRNMIKVKRILIISISFTILVASVFSHVYFDLWYDAYNRFPERCEISGKVTEIDFEGGNKTLLLDCYNINENPFSSYNLKVLLDEANITNVTVGTEIKFSAKLLQFENTGDFDSALYYRSKGIACLANEIEDIVILGCDEASLYQKAQEYRLSLSRRLVNYSDSGTGGLLSALILGEREYLDGEIKLDFSRTGLSHVLALSGMHLSILCYAFSKMATIFGLGKRGCKFFEIIFVSLYMILTGFPVSVVRAGLMVILASLLFLVARSRDSITNLLLAVTIICIFEPFSVYDVSLWLSAFAALGVIVSYELFEKIKFLQRNRLQKVLAYLFSSFFASLFAIISTLAITTFAFDTISIFSLISTIAFTPLILVFMYLGIFFLMFCGLIPMGSVVTGYGDFLTNLIGKLSSLRFSLLSTESSVTQVLVIFATVSLFLFFVLDIKKKRLAAATLTVMFVLVIVSSLVFTVSKNDKFAFKYSEFDGEESLLLKSNGEASLIAVSLSNVTSAYQTVNYLKENQILYLDNLIVPLYSPYLSEAIDIIVGCVATRNIFLKAPENQDEEYVLRDILSNLKDFRFAFKLVNKIRIVFT